MRLYKGKIPDIRDDVFDALIEEEHIEVAPENGEEVKKDIEAVLNEYHRVDNEIADEAQELEAQHEDMSFGRAKHEVADRKGIGIGDEAVGYIIEQIIEAFFHSNFVDEIYALDREITKTLAPIIREHLKVQEKLEKEAREKTKHVEEGTQDWDVEYQKVMERLKRNKNLE